MKLKRLYAFVKAEMRRRITTLKAYPFSLIVNAITFTIFILIFILALKMVGLKEGVYTLSFYPIIMTCILGPKVSVEEDIKKGRFEQVYHSAYTILEKAIVDAILSNMNILLPVFLLLIISKYFIFNIQVGLLNILFMFILIILGAVPIGIILLGINLRYRKTDAFCNIVILLALAQLMIPLNSLNDALKLLSLFVLPLGSFMAYSNIILDMNLYIFNNNVFILGMVTNILLWTVISIIVFRMFYNQARKLGTLGWY